MKSVLQSQFHLPKNFHSIVTNVANVFHHFAPHSHPDISPRGYHHRRISHFPAYLLNLCYDLKELRLCFWLRTEKLEEEVEGWVFFAFLPGVRSIMDNILGEDGLNLLRGHYQRSRVIFDGILFYQLNLCPIIWPFFILCGVLFFSTYSTK